MTYRAMLYPEDLWGGDFENEQPMTMTVHEDDNRPVPTGLVDASGMPIYRLPERVRCGFTNKP